MPGEIIELAIELAMICAHRALVMASEDEATELLHIARDFLSRAAASEGGNLTDIADKLIGFDFSLLSSVQVISLGG